MGELIPFAAFDRADRLPACGDRAHDPSCACDLVRAEQADRCNARREQLATGLAISVAIQLLLLGWQPATYRPAGVIAHGRFFGTPICIEREIRACWITEG